MPQKNSLLTPIKPAGEQEPVKKTSLLTPIKPEKQEPVSLLVRVNEVNETVVEATEARSLFPNVEEKAQASSADTPIIDLPKVGNASEVTDTAIETVASEVVPASAPAEVEGTPTMAIGIIIALVVVGVVAFIFIRKSSNAKTVVGAASNKPVQQEDPVVEFLKKEGGIDPIPTSATPEVSDPAPVDKPAPVNKPAPVGVATVSKPSNRSALNSRPSAPKKPGGRKSAPLAPNAPAQIKAPSKPKKRF